MKGNYVATGTIKFFNDEKGFGFITPDDGEKDLFVHKSELGSLHATEGTKVNFESQDSPKGPRAVNVTAA